MSIISARIHDILLFSHKDPDSGLWCIQTRHTANPEEVDYEHPEVVSCEAMGCIVENGDDKNGDAKGDRGEDGESNKTSSDDSVQIVDARLEPPRKRVRRDV
jgi:hypothetical protein